MGALPIAGGTLDPFVAGAAVGLLVGLLIAPRVWAWVTWREWRDARSRVDREARLGRDLLERMARDARTEEGSATPPAPKPR